MWRLNLSSIHSMLADDGAVTSNEWEIVQTSGKGPGRISHHTASVRPTKEVVFYGGLKGEDSNSEIFLFNPNTNAWLAVNPSVSGPPPSPVAPDSHTAVTNCACAERLAKRGAER